MHRPVDRLALVLMVGLSARELPGQPVLVDDFQDEFATLIVPAPGTSCFGDVVTGILGEARCLCIEATDTSGGSISAEVMNDSFTFARPSGSIANMEVIWTATSCGAAGLAADLLAGGNNAVQVQVASSTSPSLRLSVALASDGAQLRRSVRTFPIPVNGGAVVLPYASFLPDGEWSGADLSAVNEIRLGAVDPLSQAWAASVTGVTLVHSDLVHADGFETGNCSAWLPVCGEVAEITLTTARRMSYGDIPPATTSAPRAVSVRNDGTAPLTIDSVGLMGDHPGDFLLTGIAVPPDLEVPAGSTATWSVACTPTTSGARTATLRIGSDDSDEPATDITLSCSGYIGDLATSNLIPEGFGAQSVGSSSASTAIHLTNNAGFSITIDSATVSPGFLLESGSPTPPIALPSGGATTFYVSFAPLGPGNVSGILEIHFESSELSIGLNGTGFVP